MLFIRGVAIIVGLSAIAAVTYGTIEATGGISTNTAPLYIALGGLQVVIAMLFTHLQSRPRQDGGASWCCWHVRRQRSLAPPISS